MATTTKIFNGQTANGFSDEFSTNGRPLIKIKGTWDGATVSLQALTNHADDAFSNTGTDEAFTVDSAFEPAHKQTLRYRLALTDAGASTDLDAFVIE
jgi:phage-related protein